MTGGGGMTRGAAACSGRVIPVVRDCTQFTGRYGGGVGMFALVVRFDCRDRAAVTRFDELTAAVVQQITEKEPGTLVYATHSVEGAPLARIFYEVYRDRDAFAAHEAADHVQQFHDQKDPLLVGRRVEFLSPGRATGLVAA